MASLQTRMCRGPNTGAKLAMATFPLLQSVINTHGRNITMAENKQKSDEEWQKANDRHTLHRHEGELYILLGFAHTVIAKHRDPASVEQFFNAWCNAAYTRVETMEADRQERLPDGHPDKITADNDWPDSDHEHFVEGMDDAFTALRDALEKARSSKQFLAQLGINNRRRSRRRKK
jgi:hypothetical protein